MKFPERPTCHERQGVLRDFARAFERPAVWPKEMPNKWDSEGYLWGNAGVRTGENGSQWEPFPWRECGYCGSIHPEDLLKYLAAGAKLGGADWKYGWPHKFYITIPNPEPERQYELGATWQNGKRLHVHYGQRPTLYAKWYNDHILDRGFDDAALYELVSQLMQHSGIQFAITPEGKLHYSAPSVGYQR